MVDSPYHHSRHRPGRSRSSISTSIGFKEEEKASEDPNFYLTDGTVTLVLTETFKQDVALLAKADPEWLASKSPNLEAEYNVVLGLLQSCRYGKHQLPDPEGNLIDVYE